MKGVRIVGTIARTNEGTWRAQVRRKGKYASQTFHLKSLAQEWVRETEHLIDIGCELGKRPASGIRTVDALVNLHLEDLKEVGRPIRSSKMAVMEALKLTGSGCLSYQ